MKFNVSFQLVGQYTKWGEKEDEAIRKQLYEIHYEQIVSWQGENILDFTCLVLGHVVWPLMLYATLSPLLKLFPIEGRGQC